MSIKSQFEEKVEELAATKELLPLETRIKQVEDLTEWYFELTGKHYDNSHFLDMLATYILADTMRDRSTHKVKKAEYPILSNSQQKLRNRRESRVGDEFLDFIKLKEVDNHPNAFKTNTQNRQE
ncbi:hypothetical protein ABEY65_28115 [Priestia aryabhattai]|uniref:hypothetical protein n=1 Tax=Priestia aryabhattai TaxID=412384 RepID=UPI003D27A34A